MSCSFAGMNFLAHAYLSFQHPQILAGNMISDFVKGKAQYMFNGNIQKGIQLHRSIDEFTDGHPMTIRAKEIFRPAYRLYSGAIMDVIYDHFLATDPALFNNASLLSFTSDVYTLLEEQSAQLPPNFLQVLYYMKRDNWLHNYRTEAGIRQSLRGLARRARYIEESDTAYALFIHHYDWLRSCYAGFFPHVKQFAKQRYSELLGQPPASEKY